MSTRKVFMQQTLESTEDSQIVPKTISSQVSSTEDLDGDPKLSQQIQDLLDRFETFGAAKVATKLYTPRKIGNASFDGSANISLEDIGALAKDASAESAVKLETARSINGTPFDGTQDINISRAYNLVLEGENYENANEIYTLFAKVDLSKLPDDKIARATMILSEIENSEGGVFLVHCKCMNSTPDIQAICLQSTIKNIKFGYYIDSDDNTLYYGMRLNQTYRPHTTVTVLSREYMVTNNYGNTNTIPDGWIDIEPRYNADISDLSQYIKKAGDIMSGTLESSKTTSTYLNGNKGAALINSLASAGAYTMLDKLNSTNGYFTDGVYQGKRLFNYTAKETVDGDINAVTKSLTLLDEDGNSSFPGTLKATSFDGKLATARKIGNASFDASADISLSQIGALPSANVMNTNTVTAAGYALDARQANPNISGSLAYYMCRENTFSLTGDGQISIPWQFNTIIGVTAFIHAVLVVHASDHSSGAVIATINNLPTTIPVSTQTAYIHRVNVNYDALADYINNNFQKVIINGPGNIIYEGSGSLPEGIYELVALYNVGLK